MDRMERYAAASKQMAISRTRQQIDRAAASEQKTQKIIVRNTDWAVPTGPLLVDLTKWLKEKYQTDTIYVRGYEVSPPSVYGIEIYRAPASARISPDDMEILLKNLKGRSLEEALAETLGKMLEQEKRLPDDGNPF